MKKIVASTLVAAGMLGACTNQSTPPPDGAKPEATASSSRTGVHKEIAEPMFDDYLPGFGYELRSDKTTTDKNGRSIRRVTLEYLGTDERKLITTLNSELVNLGYKAKPWREDAGKKSTQYIKKGGSRVGVTSTPATADLHPRSRDAGGFVRFVWSETQ